MCTVFLWPLGVEDNEGCRQEPGGRTPPGLSVFPEAAVGFWGAG